MTREIWQGDPGVLDQLGAQVLNEFILLCFRQAGEAGSVPCEKIDRDIDLPFNAGIQLWADASGTQGDRAVDQDDGEKNTGEDGQADEK